MGLDVTSDAYAHAVGSHWAGVKGNVVRSFWQDPVAMQDIERRVTGDAAIDRVTYFRERYCPRPVPLALSLGSGQGHLERRMVSSGVCERIIGVDISPARVEQARAAVPPALQGRIEYVCANLETWRPQQRFDLIACKSVLHHIECLDRWAQAFVDLLRPGGLVYLDDFVGANRFQWTDTQLGIINRLLAALPPERRLDLTRESPTERTKVGRPDLERFIANDPSEAIRSREILGVLERYLEPLEIKPCGGGIYHQLFSRIMGNFADAPELVRLIMAFDEILTEHGVIDSDYVWGVYRPRSRDDLEIA
jgi:SAM-dependent methyltransferase